jgi:ubiquinone/menaquinone biosynthesis C-methylase UbiE
MVHNSKEVLEYWNQDNVESMYDKHLINAEIALIKSKIEEGSKILDAGCGEGEGTVEYSTVKGVSIQAVDFSDTRLKKASERLNNATNVSFKKVDFLGTYNLDTDFDLVISQRFLINLMEWDLQKKVISDLMSRLKPGGKFLMLEGYEDGVNELNDLRQLFGLPAIPVKWHNLFLKDDLIKNLIDEKQYRLTGEFGLGVYFLLTRGIRPYFDKTLEWDVPFNKIAAGSELSKLININTKLSRLKLWIISK